MVNQPSKKSKTSEKVLITIFVVGVIAIVIALLAPEISKLANGEKALQDKNYTSTEEYEKQMAEWNNEAIAQQLILNNKMRKIQGKPFLTEEEASEYTDKLTNAKYENLGYNFTLTYTKADGSQFDYSFTRDGDNY